VVLARLPSILFAAALGTGCATLSAPVPFGGPPVREVTVRVVRPPAINLSDWGVETVGVLPAEGPGGPALSRELAGQLERGGAFRLLGPAAMEERLLKAGLALGWDATASQLRWAQERTAVDAVVVGRVEAFRVEEREDEKETLTLRGTGEYGFVRNEEGKLAYREKKAYASVPLFCRTDQGRVAAAYRIWEVRGGAEVATVRHELSAEVPSFCYRGDVPERLKDQARDRLLQRLFSRLNEQFLAEVVPRFERARVAFEVIPGGGDGALVHRNELGILSASRGEWAQALEMWRECLVDRPDLPAAHYNLAVAYRAVGRLSLAEAHLKKAIAAAPLPLYRRALQEVQDLAVGLRPGGS